jgi:hypothetical protein
MRLLGGPRPELREIAAPGLLYAARITQVSLVEGVEKLGVSAVQGCGFEHGKRADRPIV